MSLQGLKPLQFLMNGTHFMQSLSTLLAQADNNIPYSNVLFNRLQEIGSKTKKQNQTFTVFRLDPRLRP